MKVSVITPCFNSSVFIKETIESVLSQTYQNWEMIIVDDMSTDNSVELISGYKNNDQRIKLIQLNQKAGAAEARNIALREATGRFIAFLDSDDVWFPTKLEEQIQFMNSKEIAFSFSAYELMDENSIPLNKLIQVPNQIGYKEYLKDTIIGCLTVVIDKDKTGYFEIPLIRSSHDMALWLLLMRKGFKAHGINRSLAYYRILQNSNTSNKWKAAKDVWKVYRKIEKINFGKSAFYFIHYAANAIKKRI